MKLRLFICKKTDLRDYSQGHYIRFAVIDLEKSKKYPANYVCMLPKQPRVNGKANNVFSKLFGKESVDTAKKLLKKSLRSESDIEIKKEIEKRLKLLEPKASPKIKCHVCKKYFKIERSRFRQRICLECRKKFQKRKENSVRKKLRS
jgi:hypothetical protein